MAKKRSLATRLYRGEKSFNFIGHRRRWYIASGILILVSIVSLAVRGLTPSIDFKGGSEFTFKSSGHTVTQTQDALSGVVGLDSQDITVQAVGRGSDASIVVQTPVLTTKGVHSQTNQVIAALSTKLHIRPSQINSTFFGATWGSQITKKAIIGLIVFLAFVSVYLSIRFEWKMALAAMIALLHDLIITAGIYSLVGFEVSPSTVIALLTILGYSLYDTVVVFDKVRENTADIANGNAMTFSEATNLAVNQTLVRSINTSVIALLPVLGLLIIGAGLFGAGSLDDLSLALLIGLASGAYSSIFIASPLVTDFKEREPRYQQLRKRVATRREREAISARKAAAAVPVGAVAGSPSASTSGSGSDENVTPELDDKGVPVPSTATGPAPGARPATHGGRPSTSSRARRGGSRSRRKRR